MYEGAGRNESGREKSGDRIFPTDRKSSSYSEHYVPTVQGPLAATSAILIEDELECYN